MVFQINSLLLFLQYEKSVHLFTKFSQIIVAEFIHLKSLFTNLEEIQEFFNSFFSFKRVVFKLNLSPKLVSQYLNFHSFSEAKSRIFSSKLVFSKENISIIFIVPHNLEALFKTSSLFIHEMIK
jgi:hypothetical protein